MTARYGVMAEFGDAQTLLLAVRQARDAGFTQLEAYSPLPVDDLDKALGTPPHRVAPFAFAGGVAGGGLAYFMQWYSAVVDYPLNVGGRPLHSWPMFIPITFEMVILGAALAAVLAMILGNGLPRLRHPVFDAPRFSLASRDRFFLCVRGLDKDEDCRRAERFLASLAPASCCEVAA